VLPLLPQTDHRLLLLLLLCGCVGLFNQVRIVHILLFRSLRRPAPAFKVLLLPIVLYVNWELVSPYVEPGIKNPFGSLFLITGHISSSPPGKPLYAKSYGDLLFIAFHIVFFSLVRQLIAVKACHPIARYFGLKREAKLDRFGEQGYALVYFMVFGAWGFVSVPLDFLLPFIETPLAAHHGTVAHVVVSYRVFLDWSVQFRMQCNDTYDH
jgi:hypothetical protein